MMPIKFYSQGQTYAQILSIKDPRKPQKVNEIILLDAAPRFVVLFTFSREIKVVDMAYLLLINLKVNTKCQEISIYLLFSGH